VVSLKEMFRGYSPTLGVVTNSVEFARIAKLPRRVLDLSQIQDVTPLFAKTGELSFRPIQSAALIEAAKADGLFATIGVGWGKTLIGLALPEAFDAKKAVYLVKSDLKRQLQREAETFYGKHFDLPLDRIVIVSYDELSSPKQATLLEDLSPDAIICDEAHCLRRKESARTKRFLAFAKSHPECKYAFMSGTMTTRSILDYGHLIELALRKNSPLPHGYRELRDWAGALDVDPEYRMKPGVLSLFRQGSEGVREGFKRRLTETQGVVATEEGSIGTSLVVRRLTTPIPNVVADLIAEVRKTWRLGENEFSDAPSKSRALKQLASGFYYQWDWGDGEADYEWLEARSAWNKEVRERLKHSTTGMDSPHLLAEAAKRYWSNKGTKSDKVWPAVSWPAWSWVKDRKEPPTVAIWIDDFMVDYAINWARKQKEPSIIWYSSVALGERIAEKSGLPFYDAGKDASESQDDVIVASIRSQGTGKNLQRFSRNLILELPPNGTTFEQLAGRTHRPGQLADEIVIEWLGHTSELDEAMDTLLADAEYQQATTGQRQKVLYATRINNMQENENGSF